MNFSNFKLAVAKSFDKISKDQIYSEFTDNAKLFVVDVEKDELWNTYLNSFPAGTDPLYRVRSEHDCSCCKQFIRLMGGVVGIVKGEMVSIWDINLTDPADQPYQVVADAMSKLVKSKAIKNMFLHYENHAGTDKNHEHLDGSVCTWEHFFVNIPKKFVMQKDLIASKLGEFRSTYDVFVRSLNEIDPQAVETVLELIYQNSLYRGEEQKFALESFATMQTAYNMIDDPRAKEGYPWKMFDAVPASVSKIRNTAIGTLLIDLSEGVELERAVNNFEAMVAPMNYKRPTALVTKAMVDSAKKTLNDLGLTSALERRYATLQDIKVNNILFVDRNVRGVMLDYTADVFDKLSESIKPKSFDKVEEVGIQKFISDVLPKATKVEVLLENRFEQNLVSLIAPVDPTANQLFKWDNGFSWSYNGDLTDSYIREQVKKAGGSIEGDLCCRLAWFNYDDLDFHMVEPDGYEIYFATRGAKSRSGGMLDVDMNAGGCGSRSAVENIFYSSKSTMKEGIYTLKVHNFNLREKINVGFVVEVDIEGTIYQFNYPREVSNKQFIEVMQLKYTNANGFEIISSLDGTASEITVWNTKTNQFHRVNVLMKSPNYWDDQVGIGNQHYFFMLDGCKNDGRARGFYNEFLKPKLTPHRKVIEIVGSKMKTAESENQLSGVGFSTTQRNSVTVRVTGATTRIIKVLI